jgi:hypothetical protein
LPDGFALHQNYPNPFNPTTEIRFDVPERSTVSISVCDVLGRKIVELLNSDVEAGSHSATWDASGVASGVYFARFAALGSNGAIKYTRVGKMLLVR